MTVLWPNGSTTMPRVTSEYGMRWHPVDGVWRLHAGIDLIGWSTIKSPVDGVVTFAGYNGGAGNEVRIRARNGDLFRLMHNRVLHVRYGQNVSQGQDVAIMGTTGSSTGVHCHFECRPGGGNPVNPRDYMAAANSRPAGGGGLAPVIPIDRRRKKNMIHAAWRDANGTIAVQCRPGGRITQIGDPNEWAAMNAATGVQAAQVPNGTIQAMIARFGEVPWPAYDGGTSAEHVAIVSSTDDGPSRYVLAGGVLTPIGDIDTLGDLQVQGVAMVQLSPAAIKSLLVPQAKSA